MLAFHLDSSSDTNSRKVYYITFNIKDPECHLRKSFPSPAQLINTGLLFLECLMRVPKGLYMHHREKGVRDWSSHFMCAQEQRTDRVRPSAALSITPHRRRGEGALGGTNKCDDCQMTRARDTHDENAMAGHNILAPSISITEGARRQYP